jgi:transcriptional regulator with XRE-family HTH domain
MPLSSSTPPDPPALTAARVRSLLHSRGLSQAQTARAANLGEAELSRICRRNMDPTPGQARRLLEVLDPPQDGPIAAQGAEDAAEAVSS